MGIFNWLGRKGITPVGSCFDDVNCPEQNEEEEGVVEDFSDVMRRYSEEKKSRDAVNLSTGNDLFEDLEKADNDFQESYQMGHDSLVPMAEEVRKNKEAIQKKLDALISLGLTNSKTKEEYQKKLDSYEAFDKEKNIMDERTKLIDTIYNEISLGRFPYFLSFKNFITIRDKYGYSNPKPLCEYSGTVCEEIIEVLQGLKKKGLGGLTQHLGTWKKEAIDNILRPEQEPIKTGFIKDIMSLNMFHDVSTDLSNGCLVLAKDKWNGFYISAIELDYIQINRDDGYYNRFNPMAVEKSIKIGRPVQNPIFPVPNECRYKCKDIREGIAMISDPPYMSSTKGYPSLVFFPWQDGIIIIGKLEEI